MTGSVILLLVSVNTDEAFASIVLNTTRLLFLQGYQKRIKRN